MKMNLYECDFLVDYVDVDKNGKISDWGFFKHLQEIGCLHADCLGYGLNDTFKTGLAWVLLDWKLQIFKRPVWKDKIHIRTWPSKTELACNFRDYEIYDETGNKLAIATSRWVLYDLNKRHIVKLTPDIVERFAPCGISVFDSEIEKLPEPEDMDVTFEYTVLRRDIDSNSHVNNLNYINFAKEALPEDVYAIDFSSIDVMYKKQCLVGSQIVGLYKKVSDDEHVVVIRSKDLTDLHAIVKFTK